MEFQACWVVILVGLLVALAHSDDSKKDVESNFEQTVGVGYIIDLQNALGNRRESKIALDEDNKYQKGNNVLAGSDSGALEEKKQSKRALGDGSDLAYQKNAYIYTGTAGSVPAVYDSFPPNNQGVGLSANYVQQQQPQQQQPYAANNVNYKTEQVGVYGAVANNVADYTRASRAVVNVNQYPVNGLGALRGQQVVYNGYPAYGAVLAGVNGAYGVVQGATNGASLGAGGYGAVNNAAYGAAYGAGYVGGYTPAAAATGYGDVNNAAAYSGGYGTVNNGGYPAGKYGAGYGALYDKVYGKLYSGTYGQGYGVYSNGLGGYAAGYPGAGAGQTALSAETSGYGYNGGYGGYGGYSGGGIGGSGGYAGGSGGYGSGGNGEYGGLGELGGLGGGIGGSGGSGGSGGAGGLGGGHGGYGGYGLGHGDQHGKHKGVYGPHHSVSISKGGYLTEKEKHTKRDKFLSKFIIRVPTPVEVPKYYPVHIPKPFPVKVIKPVPYPVYKNIPYPVQVPVQHHSITPRNAYHPTTNSFNLYPVNVGTSVQ